MTQALSNLSSKDFCLDKTSDDGIRGLNFSVSFAIAMFEPKSEEDFDIQEKLFQAANLLIRHQKRSPIEGSLLSIEKDDI